MANTNSQADRLLQNFIKTSQEKMYVEYQAINEHLESLKQFEKVLLAFDGKVIRNKFELAMKEVARTHVYLEINSYGTYFTSVSQFSHSFDNKRHTRPEQYKDVSFRIHYVAGTSNRLNAKETIEGLKRLIDGMEESRVSLDMSELQLVQKYEQLMKIEEDIKNLFNDCNFVVSEQLRRQSIRFK